MKNFKILAPAKINLGLSVGDNYIDYGLHQISSIFFTVDIFDEITITSNNNSNELNFEVLGDGDYGDQNENLCYRAAKEYLRLAGAEDGQGFSISLKKNIPAGAGLGGGSADAAKIIDFLNQYFEKQGDKTPSSESIKKLCLDLGNDVYPIYFGRPCLFEGLSGDTTEIEIPKKMRSFLLDLKLLVVKPKEPCPTGEMYKLLGRQKVAGDPTGIFSSGVNNEICSALLDSDATRFLRSLRNSNDFTNVAASSSSSIAGILEFLDKKNPLPTTLCGSGSSVVSFYEDSNTLSSHMNTIRSEYDLDFYQECKFIL